MEQLFGGSLSQSVVALSTAEAEFIAASSLNNGYEGHWVTYSCKLLDQPTARLADFLSQSLHLFMRTTSHASSGLMVPLMAVIVLSIVSIF